MKKEEPKKQHTDFKDLINIADWQKIQDTFSSLISVGLRTLDTEGKAITVPSNQSALCKHIIKWTKYEVDICGKCLPTFLGGKASVDKNLSFVCPPGLHNFIAPLKVDSKVQAYILIGPVILVMRKSKDNYRQLAEDLNIDIETLWKAVLDVRVISFHRVQSIVGLIKEVGEYILQLAYDNMLMGKDVFSKVSQTFGKLLNVLLDVAMQVSGADMGSIMFLDKDRDELTIRAAKNLPDNIVANTRVKVGQGICGAAVKERRPILIDEKLQDNRIKKYLYRPYLKSSMVLPIEIDDKVFGVMNLGALEVSSVRFNQENVNAMNQLIDLATDALYTPLKNRVENKSEYFEQLL